MTNPFVSLGRRLLAIEAALEPEPGEDPTIAVVTGLAILKTQVAIRQLALCGLPDEDAFVKAVSDAMQQGAERAIGELKGRN